MATEYPVTLEGGPCDGEAKLLTAKQIATHRTRCKGHLYMWNKEASDAAGQNIYYAQGYTPSGASSTLPHGHKGFNAFERALAHELPTKLRRSQAIRRHTLRKLGAPRNLGG